MTPWKSIAPSWVLQHRDIPHFCNSFWNPLRNTSDPSDHGSRPSRELGQAGLNSSSFQVIITKVLFLSTTKTGLSLDMSPKKYTNIAHNASNHNTRFGPQQILTTSASSVCILGINWGRLNLRQNNRLLVPEGLPQEQPSVCLNDSCLVVVPCCFKGYTSASPTSSSCDHFTYLIFISPPPKRGPSLSYFHSSHR